MNTYHLDYETYSEEDLPKFGAYRYASGPSTEILIYSIARNDEKPLIWDVLNCCGESKEASKMLWEMIDTESPVYAHNAQFEAALSKYLFYKTFHIPPPKLTQWRCTAAMARRAAIPSSLAACGEFLGIEKAKDKIGKTLINKFSMPQRDGSRILPQDDPEAFLKFCEYCRQDVEAEREVQLKLSAFELRGPVLEAFHFDLGMNDRGIPVNVDALEKTNKLIIEYRGRLTKEFIDIVGCNPTQYDVCFNYFRDHGYPFADLTKESVAEMSDRGPTGWDMRYIERERELEMYGFCELLGSPVDSLSMRKRWTKANRAEIPKKYHALKDQPVSMDPVAFEAMKIRALISSAAVAKVPAMLGMACDDGRCRGGMLWSGAERTHRWAGRIIQPQNFARPTFKDTQGAYQMLCDGADIDTIELFYGPFFQVVASCIRHFIQMPTGKLLQADFSSVEARGAPWLCGAENILDRFRRNEKVYELMAAKIFGVPVEEVATEQRFVGKQAVLGCGYNMGAPKFRGTCEGYNYEPSTEMIEEYKPRFMWELAKMREACKTSEPFDEWETKHPKLKWSKPRNKKAFGKFVGKTFSVVAYWKGGGFRTIENPDNPTTEEWKDLCYDDLAARAVKTWREDNPEIVQAWKSIDTAAKKALQNPGKIFHGTEKISFCVSNKPGFRALVMMLPGGHKLIYPKAKLVWTGGKEVEKNPDDYYNISIHFWGKVSGSSRWDWCSTYGGKLLENATQAICGDFMANGACNASKNGYDIFMLVHDEAIGAQGEGQTNERLCELLCELPAWAEGMPLAADGNVIPFYMKT